MVRLEKRSNDKNNRLAWILLFVGLSGGFLAGRFSVTDCDLAATRGLMMNFIRLSRFCLLATKPSLSQHRIPQMMISSSLPASILLLEALQ